LVRGMMIVVVMEVMIYIREVQNLCWSRPPTHILRMKKSQ